MNSLIYREYDIRGILGQDLTEDTEYKFGEGTIPGPQILHTILEYISRELFSSLSYVKTKTLFSIYHSIKIPARLKKIIHNIKNYSSAPFRLKILLFNNASFIQHRI